MKAAQTAKVASHLLVLLPWRGASHLEGPPEVDNDPSDLSYEVGPTPHADGAPAAPANSDIRKEG